MQLQQVSVVPSIGAYIHLALAYGVDSINGVPACANKKLLTDILRIEWGFKGIDRSIYVYHAGI